MREIYSIAVKPRKPPTKTNPQGRLTEASFQTFEDLVKDFVGRRVALIKALTTDVDKFYQECDPAKECMCLYGFRNEQWEVNFPDEMVPPDLPQPVLGINFGRDNLKRKDWLLWVAAHSDAWLVAIAFFFCARLGFCDADYRKILFLLINSLPTVTEVVRGALQRHSKESSSSSNKKPKPNSKDSTKLDELLLKFNQLKFDEDGLVKEKDEHRVCDEKYSSDEFWDYCRICKKWYHYKCVEVKEKDEHRVCDEKYSSDEFWVYCHICKKWYHYKCIETATINIPHVKQFECPICND